MWSSSSNLDRRTRPLTLAVQDKDGIDWVSSTWKDSAFRVIIFQAYFWLSLWGPDAAADAKEHQTPTQVQAADKLVKAWQEQHQVSPEVEAASKIPNRPSTPD